MKHMAELDRFLIVPDERLRCAGTFPLMHAKNRQFSDEWIGRNLEHMCQQWPIGILVVGEWPFVRSLAIEKWPQVSFQRRWKMLGYGIEQFVHADPIFRIGEEDWHDMPFIHRLFKRRMQRGVIRLFAAEIFFHQPFIHL